MGSAALNVDRADSPAATAAADAGGTWRPLGQILIEQARVNAAQLQQGLDAQAQLNLRLGETLVRLGYLDAVSVCETLVQQANLPTANLEEQVPDEETLRHVPSQFAFLHKLLPLHANGKTLSVAMANPFDTAACEAVRVLSGKRVKRYYCRESELTTALRRLYGSSVARMIADLDAPVAGEEGAQDITVQLQEMAREPSVVNLVNLVILEAIEARASDIHLEPYEKVFKVKYRIDGLLQEVAPPPKRLQPAITSRIKIMAGMNIAERFVPQDGHIAFQSPRGKLDIRVGTVPTIYGESIAMRLLHRAEGMLDMEHLGLEPRLLPELHRILTKPHGIFLVTGPTGSGKSTTLYAALCRIASPEKKIITIEDPVEYQIEGINQIAVNRKRGIDFAGGLRAILRQDPDVIMVGEIRDRETADIAIRSALTGHMVFSTLHTNDAAGAVTRLLDMGIEPFLLASSLEGVLAQRLVRRICPNCQRAQRPDPLVLRRLGADDADAARFSAGEGCSQCRQTGYWGRTGIFELLRVTEPVRQAILRRATANEIIDATGPDRRSMRQDGLRRATDGVTTIEEVLRVTQDTQTEEALT
jgi:type II secretion system protein E